MWYVLEILEISAGISCYIQLQCCAPTPRTPLSNAISSYKVRAFLKIKNYKKNVKSQYYFAVKTYKKFG